MKLLNNIIRQQFVAYTKRRNEKAAASEYCAKTKRVLLDVVKNTKTEASETCEMADIFLSFYHQN